MKKLVLSFLSLLCVCSFALAQVQSHTVTLGPGYANQAWIGFADDGTLETTMASNAEWHIAFEQAGFTASVQANHSNGVNVWYYGDASSFGTVVDTTAVFSAEAPLYNSPEDWNVGAFNQIKDNAANQFDLGWGIYNFNTHQILGNDVFVIQIGAGVYRQFMIESFIGSSYNFKHAALDGSDVVTGSVDKLDFAGKNFGYYNLLTGEFIDREPMTADWSLLFTQYFTEVTQQGQTLVYPVSGVQTNFGVSVAEAYPVADRAALETYAGLTFNEEADAIGSDWKAFDRMTNMWNLNDSLVYFVEVPTADGADIYKLYFTDFGGAQNGVFEFNTQFITAVSTENTVIQEALLELTPNPAIGTTAITYLGTGDEEMLHVFDMQGRLIEARNLPTISGLNTAVLDVATYQNGTYVVQIQSAQGITSRRLVVQK